MSSTLVPGTLPAAGSSAPGDAIPARAPPPPLLRAASSRAAEAGAPGGGHGTVRHGYGHGHGGPGPAAPGTGWLDPGDRPDPRRLGPRRGGAGLSPGTASRPGPVQLSPAQPQRDLPSGTAVSGPLPSSVRAEAQRRLPPHRVLPPGSRSRLGAISVPPLPERGPGYL